MTRRIVVTGMGALSPLGLNWEQARETLQNKRSCVKFQEGWDQLDGLQTRLGAALPSFEWPKNYTRKRTRTMGRVSMLATLATEQALGDAGLLEKGKVNVDCGIAYGSTSGSPPSIQHYADRITVNKTLDGVTPSEYVKFMSHTALANLSQFFGIKGRPISTCSACTSSSQAIGLAYETIKYGKQDVMVAGGSEELHVLGAVVFDIMYATSTRNQEPELTPRPFDAGRDGLVVGEGAGTLVLESLEHARARGAHIYAELLGFATNCDGSHIVSPSVQGMSRVMKLALEDAGVNPEEIGYINAHGTATEVGDIAETGATSQIFGHQKPISSLKSYMGHTLGACGAIEAWASIHMMNEGWMAPTINLEKIDERCAPLDYVRQCREARLDIVMSNNFAFGGVNTSLIFKRWQL